MDVFDALLSGIFEPEFGSGLLESLGDIVSSSKNLTFFVLYFFGDSSEPNAEL